MTAHLARAVGTRRAVELSLTGEFIDAADALRYGLVNHVVPHETLMARTLELASTMRDRDPDARATILDLYRRGNGLPASDALALEQRAFAEWRARRSR
jgi:enoyl-CoA hydratase